MATLEVRLLGPLQVSVSGQPVRLPAGRLSALLAVLAMAAGQPVSADRLATAVWGEASAVDARTNVHTSVRRLRRLLGAEMVSTHGGGYALNVEPDQVDALRFIRLLNTASTIDNPASQRNRLSDALSLWRGTPFHGMQSDWLKQTELPRLQERYLTGLERRIDLDLTDRPPTDGLPADGSPAELTAELSELTRQHPLRESLWVRLLVVLGRTGRPAEALERYEEIRARIAEELGTDPGPELQRVYADLLVGEAPALPGGASSYPIPVVPRQLPASTDAFIGRDEPLKALDALVQAEDGTPRPPVVVAAITGTAGVGKTTLAIHWAHQVADRFPDGTLYVNLRGFDPSGAPVEPAEAIRRVLDALQISAQAIPADAEALVSLYRSVLADRRIMLLLDNAHDADQVRPLLPGSAGCVVLVTSRNQLTGLVAGGARPLTLDLFDPGEAVHMLAHRLGHERVAADPAATEQLLSRCARLPLALAIVAARAAVAAEFPLASIADQLSGTTRRLDQLDGGDTTTNVRAVFSWSYQNLSDPAARLFRLLGLHPGPDVSTAAAASVVGVPLPDVRRALAELTRAHLLTEHTPGRYTFHDLLRAYAGELAADHDGSTDRQAATHRLLDHYVHTAHGADWLLFEHGEAVVLAAPQPGVVIQQLSTQDQALAWFTIERPGLLAMIDQAAQHGFYRHAYQLAWAMFVFLHRRGHWHDRATTQRVALDAARALDDSTAQARAHRYLGSALADLGEFADAHFHLNRALDLAHDAGDLGEQAWAYYYSNLVCGLQGADTEALSAAQRALDLFEAADDQVGRAIALSDFGWRQGRLGNHQQALTVCAQALTLHQEFGNRTYQAHTWSCLGDTYQNLDDHTRALDCFQHSLHLFRAVGDRYGEAGALASLGELHHHRGDAAAAREALRQAQDIVGQLDAPAASQLQSLSDLRNRPGQPSP